MCPVLLIRPFDTQFRMWTQMVHQASLSANFKSRKGTVGRVLHHSLQDKTLSNEPTCVLRAEQHCLLFGLETLQVKAHQELKSVQYV